MYHGQARLLVAGRLLAGVDRYLASGEHRERAEVKAARALLEGDLKPSFDELRHRAAECRASFEDWQSVSAYVANTTYLVVLKTLVQISAFDLKWFGTSRDTFRTAVLL